MSRVEIAARIAAGFELNLTVLVLAFPLAYLLGLALLLALARLPDLLGQGLATFLLALRLTPVPVQLVVLYFGSAAYGLAVPPLAIAVLVFVLHYAAFFSEKFRSAYLTVGAQQREAAFTLGLSRARASAQIVVPQLALGTYPASVNAFLGMVKDSAVLSVIALTDAVQAAKNAGALSFDYAYAFTVAAALFAAFYLVAASLATALQAGLARRYGGYGA